MSIAESPLRIAVLGAGYAGLSFCLACQYMGLQSKFSVTLFEQAPDPGALGAGVLLQPSGQHVLERFGLLAQVLKSAHPIHRIRARDGNQNYFMDLNVSDGCNQTYGCHRGNIYQALFEAAGKLSIVRLVTGTKVKRIVCDPRLSRLFSAEDEELGEFDLVVLCDGSKSELRSQVGLSAYLHQYAIGALWFCAQSQAPQAELLQVCDGTRRLIGMLPTVAAHPTHQASLFVACTPQENEEFRKQPLDRFKSLVLQHAPEAEELLSQLKLLDQAIYTRYRHGWLPAWHKGHSIVIGDAAHPMSPHLGQGINMALLDGYSLAKSLANCDDFQSAFARFTQVRQRQIRIYSWLSLVLTPFFQSRPDLGQGRARNLGVRAFLAWPWMRRQMQSTIWGRKAEIVSTFTDFERLT
jgi:2-polyprenyl-6-methoxyphenol hydroxylase-like FAD-dependent oxidoreductase